jgi:hypothetical protein
MWKAAIILDDPLVHVTGPGARTPAISAVSDFTLELYALHL